MSASSLSAAKRRRAGVQHNIQPAESSAPPQSTGPVKFTISSYLNNLDKRLILLEKNITENSGNILEVEIETEHGEKNTINFAEYMNSMDMKFELLYKELSIIQEQVKGFNDALSISNNNINKSVNQEDGNY